MEVTLIETARPLRNAKCGEDRRRDLPHWEPGPKGYIPRNVDNPSRCEPCTILLDCSRGASVQDPRRGDSTTTLSGLLVSVASTLAASQDGSKPSQSFYLFYLGAMMMSKWQPKTRGGYPVENVRPIDLGIWDLGIWKWAGEVTHPDGSKFTLTWTEDGYHGSHRQPSDSDLVPLEAPAGVSADPDPRKALAEAAKAYKRAQDAVDAAVLASQVASNAFDDAFQALGKPDLAFVVHVDGKTFVFGEDGEFSPVEVL